MAAAHDLPLTLVMRQHHEPFSYADIHRQPAGLLVDLWRLWAQRTGRSVHIVLAYGKDLENWVLDGRADVWSGIFPLSTHPKFLYSEPLMLLFRTPMVGAPEKALSIRAAVRSDRTELLALINQGFQHLTEKDRQSMLIRWWPQEGWIHLPRARLVTAALLAGAFFLLWTVGSYLCYRYMLKGKAQELLTALAELRRKNIALQMVTTQWAVCSG